MIDPALLFLIRLRWRAMFRKAIRGAKSGRGVVFFILGIALVVLWLTPPVIMAMRGEKGDVTQFRALVPMGLLGMCMLSLMTSAGERALYFSPGEVEFLFPGPFGRREVLAYKLVGTILNVLIGALFFAVMAMRYASSWVAAYVGVVLALVFVQYFTMAALMIGETTSQRAYTRARKLVVYALGALVAAAAGRVMALRGETRSGNFLTLLHESPWLKYVLAPFEPFARAMSAETIFPDLVKWASVCAAMNAALFALIILLDAEYRETAVRVSQRMYARMRRVQRSGMAQVSVSASGLGAPHFPWLGGAGPIMWHQTTNAIRSARSVVLIAILLAVAVGVPSVQGNAQHKNPLSIAVLLYAWSTILLSMTIRFDFRNDIEQMDWLKGLPIRSAALAIGQLAVPVLLCTILQALLAVLAGYLLSYPQLVPIAIAFGLPTNLMLFGVENTLFLLMPTRTATFSPGDFQVFGRQLLFMLVKALTVGIAWLVAILAGALVTLVLPEIRVAAWAAAWLVLAVFAVMTVPCAAWAFRRHDVSMDSPA